MNIKFVYHAITLFFVLLLSAPTQASSLYQFTFTSNGDNATNIGAGNVTGTFNGDANGDLITNLTNVTVAINGIAINGSGNLFANSDQQGHWVTGSAQASFSGAGNNFGFFDINYTGSGSGATAISYFDSIQGTGGDPTYFWSQGYNSLPINSPTDVHSSIPLNAQTWSVSLAPAAIPLPPAVTLFMSGLIGLGALRKKLKLNTPIFYYS